MRLADLSSNGLDELAVPVLDMEPGVPLGGLSRYAAPRKSAAPVGSTEWTDLLGSGGGEDLGQYCDELVRVEPRGEESIARSEWVVAE